MCTWTFQDFVIKAGVGCEACEGMVSDQAVNNCHHNGVLRYGGQWVGSREAMVSWKFVHVFNLFICSFFWGQGANLLTFSMWSMMNKLRISALKMGLRVIIIFSCNIFTYEYITLFCANKIGRLVVPTLFSSTSLSSSLLPCYISILSEMQ